MSDEEKRLTLSDPVPQEVIDKLRQMDEAQARIGREMLTLKKREVFLLASSKRLDDENERLFGSLLVERGLDPSTPVELDAKTRRFILKKTDEEERPVKSEADEPPPKRA